jgi:hypothetical protein
MLISNSLMPPLKNALIKSISACRLISLQEYFQDALNLGLYSILFMFFDAFPAVQRDTRLLLTYIVSKTWRGRPTVNVLSLHGRAGNGAVSHHCMTTVKMHE